MRSDQARGWGTGVWWHVYPLGALGAEREALPDGAAPVPRLRRLVPWLDHVVALGCTGVALGPVFSSSTHGYDTVDHLTVDPRLGTEADLVHLLAAAHERGLSVLLDGVFNHVGIAHPHFRDVQDRGAASPFAGWFRASWEREGDPTSLRYRDFEGHRHLPALNHRSPEVLAHVVDVCRYWLDRGADGWRLDAAYAVPLDAWRTIADGVRSTHPGAWLVGEVIHGDYAAFVRDGGLDAVTQYELWKAIWSGLDDRNMWELSWALQRHDELLDTFVPWTFLGNHDVTRIASRLTDPGHLALAVVVLMTVGGSPCLYAGDERGATGVKEDRAGGDDAVRPALPDDPADGPGAGGPVEALHRALIGVRRRHPWLARARAERGELTNPTIVWESRGSAGERLAVALNAGEAPARVALPAGEWRPLPGLPAVASGVPDDLAAVAGHRGSVSGKLELPAAGWSVLEPA